MIVCERERQRQRQCVFVMCVCARACVSVYHTTRALNIKEKEPHSMNKSLVQTRPGH